MLSLKVEGKAMDKPLMARRRILSDRLDVDIARDILNDGVTRLSRTQNGMISGKRPCLGLPREIKLGDLHTVN
jgi:hypothetical protein